MLLILFMWQYVRVAVADSCSFIFSIYSDIHHGICTLICRYCVLIWQVFAGSKQSKAAMYTIRNVLVPVDFSDCSHHALSYAKELLPKTAATLHIVHVIEPPVYPANWSYAQAGLVDTEKEISDAARQELQRLTDEATKEGFNVRSDLLTGPAADEIVRYARQHRIDIISISTHGRRGFERFLFGSTTEKVLRQAPCPVFVVRTPDHKKEQS